MIDEAGRRLIAQRNGNQLSASLVYSPAAIKAEAETTNAIITQLATDVNASPRIPKANRDAFGTFVAEWVNFYKSSLSLVDRLWFSTMEKVHEFRKRAAEWRTLLTKKGLKASTPADKPVAPGIGPEAGKIPWMWILGGASVLVGLFFVVRIVRGSMLGQAALAEAEDDAVAAAREAERRKAARKVITIT